MGGSIDRLLGKNGTAISNMINACQEFLCKTDKRDLLLRTGSTLDFLPDASHFDCSLLQNSSRKSDDHFVSGKGLFFVTEKKRLILDCTAGHYQMPWGYHPDDIQEILIEGMKKGITWDCHSDIPGNPVKALARKLVAIANGIDSLDDPRIDALIEKDGVLNRAIMSTCTGTVACAAAFRMAYVYYQKQKNGLGAPVFITFNNNYHGTDTFAQSMRGMWPGLFDQKAVEFVQVEPNNIQEIESAFKKYGNRIACFFFEPVMMNNEALLITEKTAKRMRELTAETDAMLVADEIQSCFFVPEIFLFRSYTIVPDAVVVGKGMTAGFHGQASTIFKKKFDVLAQFDALSTNGNAPLAALAALACIDRIEKNRPQLEHTQHRFFTMLSEVAREFPRLIQSEMGRGLLGGLKFHDREKALAAHKALLEQGLWVRVHAYKEGHRTLLMKFALIVDDTVIEFFGQKLRKTLRAL